MWLLSLHFDPNFADEKRVEAGTPREKQRVPWQTGSLEQASDVIPLYVAPVVSKGRVAPAIPLTMTGRIDEARPGLALLEAASGQHLHAGAEPHEQVFAEAVGTVHSVTRRIELI